MTATDEVAALQRQLKLFSEKVNEMEEPLLRQSIKEKFDACYAQCSTAYHYLGEERKRCRDEIKLLREENQVPKKAHPQQQGVCIMHHSRK